MWTKNLVFSIETWKCVHLNCSKKTKKVSIKHRVSVGLLRFPAFWSNRKSYEIYGKIESINSNPRLSVAGKTVTVNAIYHAGSEGFAGACELCSKSNNRLLITGKMVGTDSRKYVGEYRCKIVKTGLFEGIMSTAWQHFVQEGGLPFGTLSVYIKACNCAKISQQ